MVEGEIYILHSLCCGFFTFTLSIAWFDFVWSAKELQQPASVECLLIYCFDHQLDLNPHILPLPIRFAVYLSCLSYDHHFGTSSMISIPRPVFNLIYGRKQWHSCPVALNGWSSQSVNSSPSSLLFWSFAQTLHWMANWVGQVEHEIVSYTRFLFLEFCLNSDIGPVLLPLAQIIIIQWVFIPILYVCAFGPFLVTKWQMNGYIRTRQELDDAYLVKILSTYWYLIQNDNKTLFGQPGFIQASSFFRSAQKTAHY